MKNNNQPLSKDKKDSNISFVSFNDKGVVKNIKKDNSTTNNKNVLSILFIILVISLFVVSAFYNKWYLDNNKYTYKVVNKFDYRYAHIPKKRRSLLLKQIGFDKVKEQKKSLGNRYYDIVSGNRTNGDMIDSSTVYFDKDNKVKQVDIKLNYRKSDYSVDKYRKDLNCILNNFISYSIEKRDINKLFKNKKFTRNVANTGIDIEANILEINDYYVIYMTVN